MKILPPVLGSYCLFCFCGLCRPGVAPRAGVWVFDATSTFPDGDSRAVVPQSIGHHSIETTYRIETSFHRSLNRCTRRDVHVLASLAVANRTLEILDVLIEIFKKV